MRLVITVAVLAVTLLSGCAAPTTSRISPDVNALLHEPDLITAHDTNNNITSTAQHYPRLVHYLNRKGYLLKVEDLGPDQATSCKTLRFQAWQFGTKVEEKTNVVCQ